MIFFRKKNNDFCKKKPPSTRHIKYKLINFASSYKSIIASYLLQPIWNDFQDGLNLSLCVHNVKYIAR